MSNSLAVAFPACLLTLTTSTHATPTASGTASAYREAGRRVYDSICALYHGGADRPDPDSVVVQAFDPAPGRLR